MKEAGLPNNGLLSPRGIAVCFAALRNFLFLCMVLCTRGCAVKASLEQGDSRLGSRNNGDSDYVRSSVADRLL
jgi:hypothetical protein